ncbi:L-aspartate oxidase [Halomonas sp. 18H]|uniref:L-aspartate oxidase n=1 Tax=Halomonas almeriensis TaxID=308163 RepID=UPI0022315AFF|nr:MULTISPECIES: L-aspartate oxidase [Halomonas]MCW4153371.1 L-aspartate oxidase [Halomonas sp. 18H]MDN3553798.1 L-aspartate oxidase [Halomonas almeriensis]
MSRSHHDVLIIGGGVAGLAMALEVASSRSVTLLQPRPDDRGASRWAQGGIAAVLSPQDDADTHVTDTLVAGDGLCDEAAVRFTVEQGPAAIEWLLSLGVPFTADTAPEADFPYHLTREGGHSARRIIHADDATGRALIETLEQHVAQHPAIRVEHELTALDLLRDRAGHCRGAYCIDESGRAHELLATDTVLATGGASGLYRHTTSPCPASGEGMMMAAELGAELMNLEFQQFHPTCLYDPKGSPFLISEAVRGEGGHLLGAEGQRFMLELDHRAELAPRDIVARAIDSEMQRSGLDHVWLDICHLGEARIRQHFPTIHAHCASRGLDIARSPIPVVPAAHYSCGGIRTDLKGASRVPHLYAIGEVACTGLHGANRMASNSLLECLAFAHGCAYHLATRPPPSQAPLVEPVTGRQDVDVTKLRELRDNVRDIMSSRVAIVRHDQGLGEAASALSELETRCMAHCHDTRAHPEASSLRHAIRLARLTVACARQRRESRGLHHNQDYAVHAESQAAPSLIDTSAITKTGS